MSDYSDIVLPQPDEISKREKEDAMGAYFMMFAAWGIGLPLPFLNLAAAFIYYGLHRKKSAYVAFHALQSLLSQIPVTVANGGMLFWVLRTLYIEYPVENAFGRYFWIALAFAVSLNIVYFVISIIALGRARKGILFYMPVFGRLAFDRWYGPGASRHKEDSLPANLPPQ